MGHLKNSGFFRIFRGRTDPVLCENMMHMKGGLTLAYKTSPGMTGSYVYSNYVT